MYLEYVIQDTPFHVSHFTLTTSFSLTLQNAYQSSLFSSILRACPYHLRVFLLTHCIPPQLLVNPSLLLFNYVIHINESVTDSFDSFFTFSSHRKHYFVIKQWYKGTIDIGLVGLGIPILSHLRGIVGTAPWPQRHWFYTCKQYVINVAKAWISNVHCIAFIIKSRRLF